MAFAAAAVAAAAGKWTVAVAMWTHWWATSRQATPERAER